MKLHSPDTLDKNLQYIKKAQHSQDARQKDMIGLVLR
jgi:hypothetical protein